MRRTDGFNLVNLEQINSNKPAALKLCLPAPSSLRLVSEIPNVAKLENGQIALACRVV